MLQQGQSGAPPSFIVGNFCRGYPLTRITLLGADRTAVRWAGPSPRLRSAPQSRRSRVPLRGAAPAPLRSAAPPARGGAASLGAARPTACGPRGTGRPRSPGAALGAERQRRDETRGRRRAAHGGGGGSAPRRARLFQSGAARGSPASSVLRRACARAIKWVRGGRRKAPVTAAEERQSRANRERAREAAAEGPEAGRARSRPGAREAPEG